MTVPLVLVSNQTKAARSYREEIAHDLTPRIDYIEIAEKLGAELSGYDLFDAAWYRKVIQLEKRLKLDVLEALFVAGRFSRHNSVLSTSEKTAIPLAMLLSLAGNRKPHILIGHRLSSSNKARLFRLWNLQRSLAHVIVVSRAQARFAVRSLGFPESKVDFIYDKVDHRFFRPVREEPGDFILAVGQEQRDYATLLQAVAGTGLRLVVVASSPWSTFSVKVQDLQGVTVLSRIPYSELRKLYDQARMVVVPLFNSDYAAGANGVLEAMSMAKPLVLSRSEGISDYVADRETGCYVPPQDPQALKDAILGLYGDRREAGRLAANARQAVEETMNMDIYVERVVSITHHCFQQAGLHQPNL